MKYLVFVVLFLLVELSFACPDVSTLKIRGNKSVCYGTEAVFSVDSLPGCTYTFGTEGVSFESINSYTVKLIANQKRGFTLFCSVNNGCETISLNQSVTIDTSLATADLVVNGKSLPLNVCKGSSVQMKLINYLNVDCSVSFDPVASMSVSSNIGTYTVNYPNIAGGYSILATFSGSCGERTKRWDITVFDSPKLQTIIGKDSVCANAKTEFSVVATQVDSVLWHCNAKKNVVSNYLSLGAELHFADTLPNDTLRVSVKNACGISELKKPISIQQAYKEQLGVATFDRYTSSSIILAWERTANKHTVKYDVLREYGSEGDFRVIGTRQFSDWGLVEDTASDSRMRPYRYRLRTHDDCGNYVDSKIHTTMHVQMSKIDNTFNLKWNRYEGVPLSNYIVYEYIGDVFKSLDTLPAIEKWSYYSFSIPDYNPQARYRIGFEIPNIDIKKVKTDTGPFSQSFSNMSEASLVAVSSVGQDMVDLFPNPCMKFLSVTADPFSKICFYSQDGIVLLSAICPVGGVFESQSLNLPQGMCVVTVYKSGVLRTHKLFVQ